MKHTVISALCLVFVVVYSFFTLFYLDDFKNQIENNLSLNQDLPTADDCEEIEDIYEDKKTVLRFILNNELTNELEDLIVSLENSVDYNNTQDIEKYTNLLEALLDDIMYQHKCII